MKKISLVMAIQTVLFVVALQVQAQDVYPLNAAEGAAYDGATHVVIVEDEDLTTATSNTTQTLTVSVLAKQGIELVAAVLEETFQDAGVSANNSLLITVGDGTDADMYLTSTQLCEDGTEVYLKFGTGTRTVYTADDTLDLAIAPHASYGVAAMDQGKLRLYIRILDAVKRLQ